MSEQEFQPGEDPEIENGAEIEEAQEVVRLTGWAAVTAATLKDGKLIDAEGNMVQYPHHLAP